MICPNCERTIPDYAKVCGHCGHRIAIVIPPSPSEPIPTQPPIEPEPIQPLMETAPIGPPSNPSISESMPAPISENNTQDMVQRKSLPAWVWAFVGSCGTLLIVSTVGVVIYLAILGWGKNKELTIKDTVPPTNTMIVSITSTSAEATDTPAPKPSETAPAIESALPPALAAILQNPKIIATEDFRALTAGEWETSAKGVHVEGNGVVSLTGDSGYANYLSRLDPLDQGQAGLLLFEYGDGNPELNIFLTKGQWRSSNYQRFGLLLASEANIDLWEGTQFIGGENINSNMGLKKGGRYYLLIAMDESGNFLAYIWDESNPSKYIDYKEALGENWKTDGWTYAIHSNRGIIQLDNYFSIEFQGYK